MGINLHDYLTVLVIGYDPYSDVWPYFDYFFGLNCKELTCEKIFVSVNQKFLNSNNFLTLTSDGDSDVSARIRKGLSEVATPYVLLLLEDYIVSQKIDQEKILKIILEMDEKKYSFCELQNFISRPRTSKKRDSNLIADLSENQRYRISMQPAIWSTSFLAKNCETTSVRPWDFECMLDRKYRHTPINSDVRAGASFSSAIVVTNFIDKGQITKKAYRLTKKQKLPAPSRSIQSGATSFRLSLRAAISSHLPSCMRRRLKRIGKRMGKTYFTDD